MIFVAVLFSAPLWLIAVGFIRLCEAMESLRKDTPQ